MNDRISFFSLRLSLLAALGLGAAACGSDVTDGGSGAGGGSSGSTSSASTGGSVDCVGGTPVLLADGTDSGYEKCADGTIHRERAVACDPTINAAACMGTETLLNCQTDADCTEKPHGKCIHFDPSDAPDPSCGCVYSCAEDADCGAGKVCACNGVVNNGHDWSVCASASSCQTDDDCASGQCGITSFNDGCFQQVGLACRSSADACRVDADCTSPAQCATVPYANVGTFSCQSTNCAIGRPLLVSGEARKAPVKRRDDWADISRKPDVASLSADDRRALADAWLEIAALEHASIGSFARFSLDLLALGAPPELLILAQRAAADEIEHARLAYGLASHYGDSSFGPAPLDLSGAVVGTDRRAVLAALIEEACVGETLGAAEALSLANIVEDPVLRAVHARIAEDEQRHAELAWRTLRFLLDSADEDTRHFAAKTFERAIEAASNDPAPRRKTIRSSGLLSSNEIGSIRRSALRDVVKPCADAVLADRRA